MATLPHPNCNNATYIGTMYELRGDQLSKGQMLASMNCEYLARAESKSLKLYSTSQESPLYKWHMHESIWSLSGKLHTEHQTLSLSDTGCLTWSSDASILAQYCDTNNKPMTTVSESIGDNPITNEYPITTHSSVAIWIPLSVCIFATLLGIIFLVALVLKSSMFRILYSKISTEKEETVVRNTKADGKQINTKYMPNEAMGAMNVLSGSDDITSGSDLGEAIQVVDFVQV